MFAQERHNEIIELLKQEGTVTTSKLVDRFQVSIETIRRDLLELEQKGCLTRVHGGAVAKSNTTPFQVRPLRDQISSPQKASLSRKAMEFIREGDVIGIDAGSSTALYFARALKERFTTLTIVTCSLEVFGILFNHKNFSVILCGGYFSKEERTFHGSLTLDMLSRLFVQKAFIFPSTLSLEYGLYDHQEEFYLIQKQLMRSAENIYILADSSKFEKKALLKVDDMKPDYYYITDYDLPGEIISLYKRNRIRLHISSKEQL